MIAFGYSKGEGVLHTLHACISDKLSMPIFCLDTMIK
jgi:hypothetical protein